jgi:hypothetical protein
MKKKKKAVTTWKEGLSVSENGNGDIMLAMELQQLVSTGGEKGSAGAQANHCDDAGRPASLALVNLPVNIITSNYFNTKVKSTTEVGALPTPPIAAMIARTEPRPPRKEKRASSSILAEDHSNAATVAVRGCYYFC